MDTQMEQALGRALVAEKLDDEHRAEHQRLKDAVAEATVKEITRDDDRFSWYELKKAVDALREFEAQEDGE